MNCPDCFRDWSNPFPPYKKLHCQTCKDEIKRRIKEVNDKTLARALAEAKEIASQLAALTPEERHAQAEKDIKELWG